MKKAKIFYFSLTDEQTKDEKLTWFGNTKLKNIDFERIDPDKINNWLDQSDNDFDSLIPVYSKDSKNGIAKEAIFDFISLGVSTNRDEWVYDLSENILNNKIKFFIEKYNYFLSKNDESWNNIIKWSEYLRNIFQRKYKINFHQSLIIKSYYRPFFKQFYYSERFLSDRLTQNHYDMFSNDLQSSNQIISFSGISSNKPFHCLVFNLLIGLDTLEKTQCLPFYRYDKEGNRLENITDWGLKQFHTYYKNQNITKENIFHYVYAVLHNPAYRQKYEPNLKREFPRIPFYENFFQWTEWGQKLMELHINYETIEPYPLKRLDIPSDNTPKPKLKADKIANKIILDDITTLENIPKIAWDYKLGNRCAFEWILDQYKEKKPKDPTIAEKFNTYKFADYKEQVIELLQRVCTVSVETMQIIQLMEKIDLP